MHAARGRRKKRWCCHSLTPPSGYTVHLHLIDTLCYGPRSYLNRSKGLIPVPGSSSSRKFPCRDAEPHTSTARARVRGLSSTRAVQPLTSRPHYARVRVAVDTARYQRGNQRAGSDAVRALYACCSQSQPRTQATRAQHKRREGPKGSAREKKKETGPGVSVTTSRPTCGPPDAVPHTAHSRPARAAAALSVDPKSGSSVTLTTCCACSYCVSVNKLSTAAAVSRALCVDLWFHARAFRFVLRRLLTCHTYYYY